MTKRMSFMRIDFKKSFSEYYIFSQSSVVSNVISSISPVGCGLGGILRLHIP